LTCDKTRPVCIWCLQAGRVCEGLEGYNSTVIKRAINTERAEPELAAEKSPDKYSTQTLVKLVSSYSVFSKVHKVHNDKLLQLFRVKDYKSAGRLLFFWMLPSPTNRRPITRLSLDHTRRFLFELQTETGLLPRSLPVNFSFTLWPGNYTKVEFYRKAYATFQLYLCGGDLERLPQAIKKEVMHVLTPGWFSVAITHWVNFSSNTSLNTNSQHVDLKVIEIDGPWVEIDRPWDEFADRLVEALGTDKQYESLQTITKVRELGLESSLSFPEQQEIAPSSNISSHNSANHLAFEHLVTTFVSEIGVSTASTAEGGTEIVVYEDQLGEFQYLVAPSGLQRRSPGRYSDSFQIHSSLDKYYFKTRLEVADIYAPQDLRKAIDDYQLSSQRRFPPIRVIQRSERNPISDVKRKLEPSAALALAIPEEDYIFSLNRTATPSPVGNLDPLQYASVASETSHKTNKFPSGFQKTRTRSQSQKQPETTHIQDSSPGAQSLTGDMDSAAVLQIILGEFEHQEKRKRRLADELCVDLHFIDVCYPPSMSFLRT
jgi:hypothetical protein